MTLFKTLSSVVVGLVLALPATAQTDTPSKTDITAQTVLATVNGQEIKAGHFTSLLQRLPTQVSEMQDEQLFQAILDQLIIQTILAEGKNTTELPFILENERRATLASIGLDEILAQDVPEEEILAAYNAEISSFVPTVEWNASHILVETEEAAKDLVKTLNDGKDFAELAKEKSTGPSGPNGGKLGWFGTGRMVPAFEEAVKTMEVGAISEPVKTRFGWHVLILNDKRSDAAPTLEDRRDSIIKAINNQLLAGIMDEKRNAATVEFPEDPISPSAIRRADLFE